MAKKQPQETVEATPETKLAEISKEVVSIQKQADKIVVTNAEQMTEATTFAAGVKARLDRIEELRLFFTKPLLDQKKKIDDLFKAQSQPLEAVMKLIKRGMSDYALERERQAREEEAKLQAQRDAQNAKREAVGKPVITAPVRAVEREATKVHSDAGSSTQKKVWKFEITDPKKVPKKYMKIDETAIRAAVKLGEREIEGVRIYEDFDFAISSN